MTTPTADEVVALKARVDAYIEHYEDAPNWGGPTMYPQPLTLVDIKSLRKLADVRPPAADAGEVREKVARIIDPIVFKSWQSMIDHCEATGDSDEDGLHYANTTYLKTMEEARAKADAILALLSPTFLAENAKKEVSPTSADIAQVAPGFREGVEASAKCAESHRIENITEGGDYHHNSACSDIAAAIRKLGEP